MTQTTLIAISAPYDTADECPHCHMGAVVDIVEFEYVDCPACNGSGYRPGTPSALEYWKRRAEQVAAVEELPF